MCWMVVRPRTVSLSVVLLATWSYAAPPSNPPIAIWGNDGKQTKIEPIEDLESTIRYTPPRATPGQPWNVMLVRTAAIESGTVYRVIVEARAAEKRSAVLSIDQRKSPYANHDFQQKVDLQPQWQTIVYAYRPIVDDPECNLSLRISESAVPVELRRLILEPASNIETGWGIGGKGYLQGRVIVANTKPEVVRLQPITTEGSSKAEEMIVMSPPMPFVAGQEYRCLFVSRTKWPTFVVGEARLLETLKPVAPRQTFQAQKNWTNHNLFFRASETGMGRICFIVSEAADSIDFANIRLQSNEWQLKTDQPARAVHESVVTDPLTQLVKIEQTGSDANAIRLARTIEPLVKGVKCQLSVEARSSKPRQLDVALGGGDDASPPGPSLASISSTEKWSSFSAEFTADTDATSLIFRLGFGDSGEVELRRVVVRPVQ